MKVSLFIPCTIDQFMPDTAVNTFRVLEKAGCQVELLPQQTCCGMPAYQAGHWDKAKTIGEKFLKDIPENQPVIVPSAACVSMVKNGYNDLFTNTTLHNRCRSTQTYMYELSDFLIHVLGVDYFGAELETRAMYMDSCSALRGCGIKAEPRQLLKNVAGFELIESAEAEVCCGAGGGLAWTNEQLASAMAEQKLAQAIDLGAECIVSTDAACLLHLKSYIDQQNLLLKTYHLADVLTTGWPNI